MNLLATIDIDKYGIYLYGLYVLLCLPLAYIINKSLPKIFHKTSKYNFWLFYLFMSTIFIGGILIVLTLYFKLRNLRKFHKKPRALKSANLPDYQRPPVFTLTSYGEGSGYATLKNPNISKDKKKEMLIAINQFNSRNANVINRSFLGSDEDEIRLYAQNLLEKQERSIFALLNKMKSLVAETKDKNKKAQFQKHIAQLMWDQIQMGLIDKESLSGILDRIETEAEAAFASIPDDSTLPVLLAIICLKKIISIKLGTGHKKEKRTIPLHTD